MPRFFIAMAVVGLWTMAVMPTAEAAPCLLVTLTGTQSGPAVFNGQAGAGTLIRFGDDSNECGAVKLQFDAGRGTNMRLSQLNVTPGQLNAIFFTHMHSDHTEGFADIMFASLGLGFDEAETRRRLQRRCDIAVRLYRELQEVRRAYWRCIPAIRRNRPAPGRGRRQRPSRRRTGRADQCDHLRGEGRAAGRLVAWRCEGQRDQVHPHPRPCVLSRGYARGQRGDRRRRQQRRAHAAARHSTSDQVELLAKGVDVIVHSTMHPVMGPDRDSGMPPEVFIARAAPPISAPWRSG